MKKKILILTVLLILLTLGMAGASAAEYGVIHRTDALNLRSQGSSDSQWLGSYPRGTWVEINGSQNNFYRVITPDGRTGYMSKNYIDTGDGYCWTAVVTNQNGGAFLNFRAQPSYYADVLDIFYYGVPLRVLGAENGWYRVSVNDQTGYVRQEFILDHGSLYRGSNEVYTIKTPNNTPLNMRSGPGMQYGVIRQFGGDRYVMVLASGGGWSLVSIDGYVGFMSSDYLEKGLCSARDLAANKSTTAAGQPYAVVANPKSTQALNLRQYASTGSRVLDKLYNGTKLWVNDQGAEWCAVTDQTTGLSGYVMTQYISLHNLPSVPERKVNHPGGSYVNLRSAPDMTRDNVLCCVPDGQRVTVLVPGPDWCRVRYGNTTGYMLRYFLD